MVQMLSVVRTLCCCYKKERPTEGNDTKLEEAGEAPPTCIDLERYTEPKSIWVALETGHVRLVKMSWLIEHSKNGRILARRQELPEEAFISVAELKRLYGDGNRDGVLPIIAISFCWLTPWHPDPEGKQLKTIAATLEREQAKYAKANGSFKGFSEMGVFWDWTSLYQLVPSLWRPFMTGPEAKKEAEQSEEEREQTKAYFNSRTKEEQEGFAYALHNTMDLWYAHQGTSVYMLTKLPENSSREVGYSDSGWTTYERCSAEQIKKVYMYNAEWKLVLDLGETESEKQRNWPVGPDDFDRLVEEKKFTNGADTAVVKKLFRKMSINQLGGIKELDFTGIAPPTTTDAEQLGQCLNLCKNLEKCDLQSVGISAEACVKIFSTLGRGALPKCTSIYLNDNPASSAARQKVGDAIRNRKK